jgi:hypothetical protein
MAAVESTTRPVTLRFEPNEASVLHSSSVRISVEQKIFRESAEVQPLKSSDITNAFRLAEFDVPHSHKERRSLASSNSAKCNYEKHVKSSGKISSPFLGEKKISKPSYLGAGSSMNQTKSFDYADIGNAYKFHLLKDKDFGRINISEKGRLRSEADRSARKVGSSMTRNAAQGFHPEIAAIVRREKNPDDEDFPRTEHSSKPKSFGRRNFRTKSRVHNVRSINSSSFSTELNVDALMDGDVDSLLDNGKSEDILPSVNRDLAHSNFDSGNLRESDVLKIVAPVDNREYELRTFLSDLPPQSKVNAGITDF